MFHSTQAYDAHLGSRTAHGLGKVTVVTEDYTVLPSDYLIVCNSAFPITLKLPVGVQGRPYSIKNIGSGVVSVECLTDGDEIEEEEEQEVRTGDCMKVQYLDDGYWII